MTFESTLEDAFANNNAATIADALHGEKASKTLINRLDKVASKELDRNEFKNVSLLLRAIESLCESDEDVVQSFVQQGLVVKIMWLERATGFLKVEELKSAQGLSTLIEEFFDVSMSICRISVEGKGRIQDIFVLRYGMLVIDTNISFSLRLEAIRTINSMLDSVTKEERKKFILSDDHCLLLEEFAKLILSAGDYEMQVAISEALCRMTIRKWREEAVYKWFSSKAFADSFKAINDRDFETDCRKFLNEVNNSFGDERRVFTFPCIKAFLDLTELFMPDDKNLDKFWIDFNLGTSCISFFVNDPEGVLWESMNLAKEAVSGYNVLGCDDQKILTVCMASPICHSKTKGKTVQIIFDSHYDVETVVQKVFGKEPQLQRVQPRGQSPESVIAETVESVRKETLPSLSGSADVERADVSLVGHTSQPERPLQQEPTDIFHLNDHSDTEVAVSESPVCKGLSHVMKTKSLSFMAALKRYQVARAKVRLFSHSTSSSGSAKSTPVTGDKQKELHKTLHSKLASESDSSVTQGEKSLHQRGSDRADYTRKKPKSKSKLKILPLSSASSADEPSVVKHSTPVPKLGEQQFESNVEKPVPTSNNQSFENLPVTSQTWQHSDSGIPEEIEVSAFDQATQEECIASKVAASPSALKRKKDIPAAALGLVPEKRQVLQGEDQSRRGLTPRRLFPSTPLESTTERTTTMLTEDTESETEMGSGVIAAFQTFKNQLREHFASRYRKIESRSMESLADCQKNVTSLLSTVHNHRLMHLERFQATVVTELANLEQDCLSLKEIERETMNFWKNESETVGIFCNRQQTRLQSLELLRKSTRSGAAKEDVASSAQETPLEKDGNVLSAKTPTTT